MGKTLVRDESIPEAPSVDPAEIDKFAKDPKLDSIGDLFTVSLIVRFVEMKLKAK